MNVSNVVKELVNIQLTNPNPTKNQVTVNGTCYSTETAKNHS
ncbi:MAG: hypothetical protein HMLIMOIP_000201 [Candidatus Nitrosomirales archaeon]|jgi:hypothetical protein